MVYYIIAPWHWHAREFVKICVCENVISVFLKNSRRCGFSRQMPEPFGRKFKVRVHVEWVVMMHFTRITCAYFAHVHIFACTQIHRVQCRVAVHRTNPSSRACTRFIRNVFYTAAKKKQQQQQLCGRMTTQRGLIGVGRRKGCQPCDGSISCQQPPHFCTTPQTF